MRVCTHCQQVSHIVGRVLRESHALLCNRAVMLNALCISVPGTVHSMVERVVFMEYLRALVLACSRNMQRTTVTIHIMGDIAKSCVLPVVSYMSIVSGIRVVHVVGANPVSRHRRD